ncbi:MAG: NYN domain-containing protein [Candidatus Pacebacteria bacterium]|nr:NYN domain-containing protein [Candidatus Paceibacterota bacterium]
MDKTKRRIAFIDVYNTVNTTERLHNFVIDWRRLYDFLKNKWACERVFFYAGIEIGDVATEDEYALLKNLGYEMRTKPIMLYKRKNKTINIVCFNCGKENVKSVPMGYDKKSNCDSELTVDALELAKPNTEIILFTGDGDFAYLIERLVVKGASVVLVSSNKKPKIRENRRFSSRLRKLLKTKEVDLVEINNIRKKIEKINIEE